MAYLTDTEKRILFSALLREKEVCIKVDNECCREPYEETLKSVVDSLEHKFYYDRYEKEIRNKTIEDVIKLVNFLIADLDVEGCTKYGNENAEQENKSYDTLMKYEIAGSIDDLLDRLKRLKY